MCQGGQQEDGGEWVKLYPQICQSKVSFLSIKSLFFLSHATYIASVNFVFSINSVNEFFFFLKKVIQ